MSERFEKFAKTFHSIIVNNTKLITESTSEKKNKTRECVKKYNDLISSSVLNQYAIDSANCKSDYLLKSNNLLSVTNQVRNCFPFIL